MSTGVSPESPTPDNTTPSPSSAAPGTSPPSAPAPTEWRAGASAPEWARGKTAEEVLGLATQMAGALQQYVSAPTPSPVAPAPSPTPTNVSFGNDDFVTGGQLSQWAQSTINSQVQPQIQAVTELSASLALDSVRRNNAVIFEKYGPEVYGYLGRIPKNQWTIDNLSEVVNIVRGRHVDEIAAEKAQRLVAEMGPTVRSGGGAGSVPLSSHTPEHSVKSELLPADYRAQMEKAGITDAVLDEFCRANDMTRADWFKAYGKTAITEANRRG